jgi:DNA-binding GntR family transcriptional regulator
MATLDHSRTTSNAGENNRGIVLEVYQSLRTMILNGSLPPGAIINQKELAKELGVSRTPLREVVRMLQNEGLIVAELNQRARVATFLPLTLDAFYAQRILVEMLGVRLTIPQLQESELVALRQTLQAMEHAKDSNTWEEHHRRFHALLVSHSNGHLQTSLRNFNEKSEFYRRIYGQTVSFQRAGRVAQIEHSAILEAVEKNLPELAAQRLASHLARTALDLLTGTNSEYEPLTIQMALQIISDGSNNFAKFVLYDL